MDINSVIGNICGRCGECCTDLPDGPMMSTKDMGVFVEKLGVSGKLYDVITLLSASAAQNKLQDPELDAKNYCPCLTAHADPNNPNNNSFMCSVYEARPQMCRDFGCTIYWDLREFYEHKGHKYCLEPDNLFKDCENTDHAFMTALEMVQKQAPKGATFPPRFKRRMTTEMLGEGRDVG